MKFRFSSEHLTFLKKHYQKLPRPELTRHFNEYFELDKSEASIHSALSNHKIHCGRKTGKTAGRYRIFSKLQAQFIRDHYKTFSIKGLAEILNRSSDKNFTESQIRCFTRNQRIRSGRTGFFPKGHIPWSAGTKGVCKTNSGCFQKGHCGTNTLPVGHERINKDGYIEMKINEPSPWTGCPTRFKAKHVAIWEAENGPVPDGFAVIFKDGNKANCIVENLLLVSRAELARLNQNGYKEAVDEVKPSILALSKLQTKLGVLKRKAA